VFPAIKVGIHKNKKYVLDGWHRIGAKKILKEEYVSSEIKQYTSKKEMFADAVRYNSVHGRQLSPQEKSRIINLLEDYKFTFKEISEIIKVPVDQLERFKAKTIMGPNGKTIYLKSPLEKIDASNLEKAGIDQKHFNVMSLGQLLKQLIELLDSGVYPEDENTTALSTRLFGLLKTRFEL